MIAEKDTDELVWHVSSNSEITNKLSYEFYREKSAKIMWYKRLWASIIPPKISLFAWRVPNNRISMVVNLCKRKMLPSTICVSYIVDTEEMVDHLMLHCIATMSL